MRRRPDRPAGPTAALPRSAGTPVRDGLPRGTGRGRSTPLLENANGKLPGTRVAGGFGGNFTGVVVGTSAHSAPR